MSAELGILLTLLTVFVLLAVGITMTAFVLDFLLIGRRGRLDWIAGLFKADVKPSRKVHVSKHTRRTPAKPKSVEEKHE